MHVVGMAGKQVLPPPPCYLSHLPPTSPHPPPPPIYLKVTEFALLLSTFLTELPLRTSGPFM